MVEYGKQISEYNIGDVVHVYRYDYNARVIIIQKKQRTVDVQSDDSAMFMICLLSSQIVFTEQEYEDMRLERKFGGKW